MIEVPIEIEDIYKIEKEKIYKIEYMAIPHEDYSITYHVAYYDINDKCIKSEQTLYEDWREELKKYGGNYDY